MDGDPQGGGDNSLQAKTRSLDEECMDEEVCGGSVTGIMAEAHGSDVEQGSTEAVVQPQPQKSR